MSEKGDIELRIVRGLATLGFFAAVTLGIVNLAGAWGYVVGAVLYGGMAAFLWRDEVRARATERVRREADANAQRRAEQQAVAPPTGAPASWS
jgi:hypothetical protein